MDTRSCTASAREVIERLYELFNGRHHVEASALFADTAVIEHAPVQPRGSGYHTYLTFAESWLDAFPDASLKLERLVEAGAGRVEVDVSATGTHLGPLRMGSCGTFKPSGTAATLHLRQLVEVRAGQIAFSSLSFDLQDIVYQLVTVDVTKLLDHLRRLQGLATTLAMIRADDVVERWTVLDRLGRELDLARHVVRPYFGRPETA